MKKRSNNIDMPVPDNPIEFYTHPIFIIALSICLIMIFLDLYLIMSPKIRKYFRPLYKIYYIIALIPMYIIAGVLYLITIKRVNLFNKLKEINFYSKFENFYLKPTVSLREMRNNPRNYHLWVAIFISIVFAIFDTVLIILVAEKFYHGQDSIITGFLNSDPPLVTNPFLRGLLNGLFGLITFIPTYFTIHFLGKRMSKTDFEYEQLGRSKYEQVRLIYISWAYFLFPDVLWCLGFILTLAFNTWEALIFTWIFGALCGILEFTYQVYTINGIYDIQSKAKSLLIWLASMIPAIIFGALLLHGMLAPLIENSLSPYIT